MDFIYYTDDKFKKIIKEKIGDKFNITKTNEKVFSRLKHIEYNFFVKNILRDKINENDIIIPFPLLSNSGFAINDILKFEEKGFSVTLVTNNVFDFQEVIQIENVKRYIVNSEEKIEIFTYGVEEIYFIAYKKFMTCSYKLSNMISDILDKALYLDKESKDELEKEMDKLRYYCTTNSHFEFIEKSKKILSEIYLKKLNELGFNNTYGKDFKL